MESEKSYQYSRRRLYFSAIGALTLHLGVGIVIAYPSPVLPLLQPRNFTSFENSLIGSLGSLAPGPLITMFGIDRFGRKGTLLINWLAMMSCWVILCITEELYAILVAIFISGCGMTATFLAVGIYISEIADVGVRGPLNGMSAIFMTLGMLAMYSIGPFLTFKWLSAMGGGLTSLFGLFYFFLPESPYYYLNKGKIEEAYAALAWLRAGALKENIEKEMLELKNSIEEEKKRNVGFGNICSSKAVLKEFIAALFILSFIGISGQGPMAAYLQTIFASVVLSYNPGYITATLAVVSLLAALPVPIVVKLFGNKLILIVSGFGCAVGNLMLSSYFFLLQGGYNVSSMSYIPILGSFILSVLYSLGLGGLIWGVVSDIFPQSVKGIASGICGIYAALLVFTSNIIFGLVKDAYGFGWTFLGFSVIVFISSFGLFFTPNVTHLTLQEIQDYFEGNSKSTHRRKQFNEIEITG